MGFAHLFYLLLFIFSQYNNCCKIAPRKTEEYIESFPSPARIVLILRLTLSHLRLVALRPRIVALFRTALRISSCVPLIVKLRPRIVESFTSLHSHLVSYISQRPFSLFALLRSFAHFCIFGASHFRTSSRHCALSTLDSIRITYSGSKNCPNVFTISSIHFIAPPNVKIRIKCGSTPESPASWLSFNIWVKEIGHYISKI